MIRLFKKIKSIKKWAVLKAVWQVAIMVLLLGNLLFMTQGIKSVIELLGVGFGMITNNQKIINDNIVKHTEKTCQDIKI